LDVLDETISITEGVNLDIEYLIKHGTSYECSIRLGCLWIR
jgi:hypothetical protein